MRGQRDAYTFLRFTAKNCSCIPSGRTIREVAKRFMVTKRTVHRLVQQYKQTQDLTPKGTSIYSKHENETQEQ
jgi:transposase